MNATADRDWREDVRDVPIVDVAEALGFEATTGRGERRRYHLAHAGCDGTHSKGDPAVYVARKANRLKCRRCGERMSGVDLVAMALGLDPARLDGAGWDRIRESAALHGWCLPDPRAGGGPDPEVWRQERAARAAERQAQRDLEEAERRAGAIDVHTAWNALAAGRIGHQEAAAWARRVRGVPEGLIEHLPWDDLVGVPAACPPRPVTVREDDWREAVRLMSTAHGVDRRILIAQRDAEGRPIGASRRWHRAGAPPDGLPKALALSEEQALEGAPSSWPGGCAFFGDLSMAAARALRGEPVFLVEGGPDWLIATAALRRSRYGTALGAPGVSTMPRIAAALRAALWAGPPPSCRPRVVIIPDRGQAAEQAAWQSAGELQAIATIQIRRTGADDFNDMVQGRSMTAEAVIDFLLGGRW